MLLVGRARMRHLSLWVISRDNLPVIRPITTYAGLFSRERDEDLSLSLQSCHLLLSLQLKSAVRTTAFDLQPALQTVLVVLVPTLQQQEL